MRKHFFLAFLFLALAQEILLAQDFITRGKIEYEVKVNNKLMAWGYGDDLEDEPRFDISYRELIFSGNRYIYMPGRKPTSRSGDVIYVNENMVYIDLDKYMAVLKVKQIDESYVYKDSLNAIRWKIENDTRRIAGWNCRKAIGRIFDSVYVVAFYCPEIIPQGGPELFTGLPGMILGLAIPRYYTTWFATRIEIANIDEDKITVPVTKKNKQYTKKELAGELYKKYKDAGWWEDVSIEKVEQLLSRFTL